MAEYPRGSTVPFPRRPYPQQVDLMDTMLQAIATPEKRAKIVLLESPTGTGKSLSLACASLAWLDYQQQQQQHIEASHKQVTSSSSASASASASSPTGLDWIDSWQPSEEDASNEDGTKQQERRKKQDDRLHNLQESIQQIRQTNSQNTSTRSFLLKQAITKSKIQARKEQRMQKRRRQRQHQAVLLEFEEDDEDSTGPKQHPIGSAAWMLEPPSTLPKHKIVYAARTHSQLSQFVNEVRKTHWGKTTKVISLASRSQGLCGYLSSSKSRSSEANLTEECLELRQSKKRSTAGNPTCGCPFYQKDAIATLALHALAEPTDVEDWKELGQSSATCSYYASRQALPHADLIVLPYSMLVAKETRESIGLDLENALVLIDEAHNLPQAIANLQSCTVSATIIDGAMHQVQTYTAEYMDRLSPRHLLFLGQLKTILKAFQKCLSKQKEKILQSSLQFLCEYKLDRINLFPLLRYMADSKLSQKLLGFVPLILNHNDDGTTKKKKKSTLLSPMAVIETFLSKLNYANDDGKIVICETELQFVVLNPAVVSEDDLYHKPHALCLVGGTLQPMNVMIQELVPSLAKEALLAQNTIANNNGTAYTSDSLVAFSCGHVVPRSNVLLQAITEVDGVTLDIRHKTRSLPNVMTAIGKALVQLAERVPNGMVVFMGSYKYEQMLVDHWQKNTRIWKDLNAIKTIFREPKDSKLTDAVLTSYGEKASSSSKSGALLLSVMGGKLSEGINFANELCRCVVVIGLPYPDPTDPLLQEKLKLLPSEDGIAGNHSYLRSLCLRSVNQSVGRAIRHANDYASIILMDARYPRQDAIARGLPQWLTNSTPEWRTQPTTLSFVERQLEEFFKPHES